LKIYDEEKTYDFILYDKKETEALHFKELPYHCFLPNYFLVSNASAEDVIAFAGDSCDRTVKVELLLLLLLLLTPLGFFGQT
jgi:hypothetical protein